MPQCCQDWHAYERKTPLSCSDKILRWQSIGWQGSKLYGMILNSNQDDKLDKRNLVMSTITVGRK